jgi:hypothetical protein
MIIAAEMTLTGLPAARMPDNWPCYDVIAQPKSGGPPQRVSVKARTFKKGSADFVVYNVKDDFDWLAIVLLPGGDQKERKIYIVPKPTCDAIARRDRPTSKTADNLYWRLDEVERVLGRYANNFRLESR